MSLSMLRTSLRSGQPSFARGLATSAIRSNSSQPLKPAHPADVVSGNVAGPPTVHESPRVLAAEVVSDAPRELQHRQVRIYRPTKSTMQSAKGKTKKWILDWDVLSGSGRWENPLMGWASSADYMQGTTMAFRSQEDAVAFAERQGWNYYVQKPHEPKIPPKNYASNYNHIPGKLRIHHTK